MSEPRDRSDEEMELVFGPRRNAVRWTVVTLLSILTLASFPLLVHIGELAGYDKRNPDHAVFGLLIVASPFVFGAAAIIYGRWAWRSPQRNQSAGHRTVFRGISIALIVFLCVCAALIAGVLIMLSYYGGRM